MAGKRTRRHDAVRAVDLHITVSLSRVPSDFPPASCQVAIDVDGNGAPEDGEYVTLTQKGMTWSGSYRFVGDPLGKRVMVGLMGCIHAKYKIEVRRDSTDGAKLIDDEGPVADDPDGFMLWMEDMA
jgi:hypothetical protein